MVSPPRGPKLRELDATIGGASLGCVVLLKSAASHTFWSPFIPDTVKTFPDGSPQ
jgi:hypothetical protein